jgi:hypothetical protein
MQEVQTMAEAAEQQQQRSGAFLEM